MDTIICRTCQEVKLCKEFYIKNHNPTRYFLNCKFCEKAAALKRYKSTMNNPALANLYRQSKRLLYAKDPSKFHERNARYKANNPEAFHRKARRGDKRWRENHPQEVRQRGAHYHKTYLERHRERHVERQRRRRAQQANAPLVEKIIATLIYARDKDICQLCFQRVLPHERSLDHIVPLSKNGEHSYRNLVLTHKKCNSSKGNRRRLQQMRLF